MTAGGRALADVTKLTRRAAIGGLAAAGLGFIAFGPRGAREQGARGRIVLDYWEKWTRHERDAMVKVVDAFNASQNRIFVRCIVTSDIGQKSLVAIAGGDPSIHRPRRDVGGPGFTHRIAVPLEQRTRPGL